MTDPIHQEFVDKISAHVLLSEIPKAQAKLLISCVRHFETEEHDASILNDIRVHYRIRRRRQPTLAEVYEEYQEVFRWR